LPEQYSVSIAIGGPSGVISSNGVEAGRSYVPRVPSGEPTSNILTVRIERHASNFARPSVAFMLPRDRLCRLMRT
jgi:hypothetical protein